MSDVIRSDKEELTKIAKIFTDERAIWEGLLRELRAQYGELCAGAWKGKAANAFFLEMENEIFVGYEKLLSALLDGGNGISQICQIFETAEEEAKSCANFTI